MTLLEKLDLLKQQRGDTNASLARNSDIPYTTIDGLYKKGYKNIKLKTLQDLANYFGCSLDFLARDDLDTDPIVESESTEEKPTALGELTESETAFLKKFSGLTPENRHVLLVIASALLRDQEAAADHQS